MPVEKSIDLAGTGPTIEEAVAEAIHRATLTIQGLTNFEVTSVQGSVRDGSVEYRVQLRVWFLIKERVHE